MFVIKDKIGREYQSFHINFHHFASTKQFDDSYLFMYEYLINPLESLLMPQKFSFNNQRLISSNGKLSTHSYYYYSKFNLTKLFF